MTNSRYGRSSTGQDRARSRYHRQQGRRWFSRLHSRYPALDVIGPMLCGAVLAAWGWWIVTAWMAN